MYSIATDDSNQLVVTLEGRVTRDEAMRAVSQLYALAEAGAVDDVTVDVRRIERGPSGLLGLGAAIALYHQERLRVAVVGHPRQLQFAERLVRYSGIRGAVITLPSRAAAERWFESGEVPERLGISERHHMGLVEAAPGAPDPDDVAGRVSRAVTTG